MQDITVGFRDPHAALRDIILAQWYNEQLDQPMLDAVGTLGRDVALLVWNTIQVKFDEEWKLNSDELREFILKQ